MSLFASVVWDAVHQSSDRFVTMLILGNIAIVLIAVLVLGLAIVWLVFQDNPFDQSAEKVPAWRAAADYVIGGAILALCALGAWIGKLTGMW